MDSALLEFEFLALVIFSFVCGRDE